MRENKSFNYGSKCGLHNRILVWMTFLRKIYTESWSPKYNNRQVVKHWFNEWNTRGKVMEWKIKQFFHKDNQTVVEWYFKNEMNNGNIEEFDGMSLIVWTADNKIKSLKEFGCNLNSYNPYEDSDTPKFRDEKASWF